MTPDDLYDIASHMHVELRKQGLTVIEAIMKGCESHPELFRRFMPKVYDHVDDYTSTKRIAALLMDLALSANLFDLDPAKLPTGHAVAYRPVCDMIAHKVPMYFVTRDLVAAAMKTDYKDEIDFMDIHLPFEAGVFVLPKNTLVHPQHGDCSWIGWGRSKAGVSYTIPGVSVRPLYGSFDTLALFTAAHSDPNVPWIHYNLADTQDTPRIFRIPDLVESSLHLDKMTAFDQEMAATDDAFLRQVIKLAFNLFLIIEARPGLLKSGSLRKKVVKANRTTEFWSPNILGHDYKIRCASVEQETSVAVTGRRSHWVRGHGRMQPHGPKNSLRKAIWIEPYWVDTGEE